MAADLQWLAAESGLCRRRVMLVYAHPDDEAIAVGGRLRLLRDALFVQVTDGAPRDEADSRRLGLSREQYGEQREQEACAALRAGGAPAARRVRLGLVDKEAALHLGELALQLEALLKQERPEVVLTHAFEGGHADHDACAWAVRTAADRCGWRPLVLESPFYYEADAHEAEALEAGAGEAGGGVFRSGSFRDEAGEELRCALSEAARARKGAMFAAHASQAEVLRGFAIGEERFRVAPRYDFAAPLRRAWYERFIEGMTAERFARLARAAAQELGTGVAA